MLSARSLSAPWRLEDGVDDAALRGGDGSDAEGGGGGGGKGKRARSFASPGVRRLEHRRSVALAEPLSSG